MNKFLLTLLRGLAVALLFVGLFALIASPVIGIVIIIFGGVAFVVLRRILLSDQQKKDSKNNREFILNKKDTGTIESKSQNEKQNHEDDMNIGVHLKSKETKQIGSELQEVKGSTLENQCEKEGIPLKTVELSTSKGDRPELQGKYFLLNKSTYDYDHVYFMENEFSFLFQIMFYNYTSKQMKKSDYLNTVWDFIFDKKHKTNLVNEVRNMNSRKLKKNFNAYNKHTNIPDNKIRKSKREKFLNIFSAIDKMKLIEASKLFISENAYYKGWPDLVAVKLSNSSGITFFEVKTTDNLLTHQMFIFRRFRNKADFDMRVLKLSKETKSYKQAKSSTTSGSDQETEPTNQRISTHKLEKKFQEEIRRDVPGGIPTTHILRAKAGICRKHDYVKKAEKFYWESIKKYQEEGRGVIYSSYRELAKLYYHTGNENAAVQVLDCYLDKQNQTGKNRLKKLRDRLATGDFRQLKNKYNHDPKVTFPRSVNCEKG